MFKAVAIFEHHAIRKFVYQSMRILHRGFWNNFFIVYIIILLIILFSADLL